MKAKILYTDNSACEGELFSRYVDNVKYDDEKALLYIYESEKIVEIINMQSRNFHSVSFEGIK